MVVAPLVRAQRLEISAFTRAPKPRDQSLVGTAAWVFGFNPTTPDRYPLTWWVVVTVALAVAKAGQSLSGDLLGGLAWIGIPIGWVALSRAFFGYFDRRIREQLLAQFPEALAMIVRSVRVGIPVQEAIRTVAREQPEPTGLEFSRLVDQVSVGVSMEDAMREMADRTGLPEYRFFATALSLQNQTGGALSETLDNLADVIRKRAALKAKGLAMTSEAKATAAILAALPVLIAVLLWAVNPEYISVLFTDPSGRRMLVFAIMSLGMGLFVIRTIIRRSLPA
jgi:tight adherence protein B